MALAEVSQIGTNAAALLVLRRSPRQNGVGTEADSIELPVDSQPLPMFSPLEASEAILNYVLDTNAVSAAMKGDPNVLERMRAAGRKRLAVPEPVYAEIAYGIERLPKSKKRSKLLALYNAIYEELGSMPWTHGVTEHFVSVKSTLEHKGKRIEDFDAAIAAHALAAGAILATADLDHMERVLGLKVEDWAAALSRR